MTNANVTWVEDMMFVAQGDSGHAIVMDAGESAGGHDLGSRPMEVLLMGLLGCTSMDVISILKKKRQPVEPRICRVRQGGRAGVGPRSGTLRDKVLRCVGQPEGCRKNHHQHPHRAGTRGRGRGEERDRRVRG